MNRLGVQVFMRLFIPLNSAGVRCHRWGAGLCHALRDYVWLRFCCAHWLSRLALSPYIDDSRRIRMISDSVRSSCAASSCRSRLSESGSRTVISAIFFSMDMGSEIKGARGLSLAKVCGPDFENRRRGGREAGRHLCGLLVALVSLLENLSDLIDPQRRHFIAPFVNGLYREPKAFGQFSGRAKCFDCFGCFHGLFAHV